MLRRFYWLMESYGAAWGLGERAWVLREGAVLGRGLRAERREGAAFVLAAA